MTQEEMFPEESFGMRVAKLIRTEEKATGARDWMTIARLADEELARSFPKRRTKPEQKESFLAFILACGIELSQMTADAQRLAATSLEQIRKASPQVDRAEFERRVRKYRQMFPGAPVTPRAIAMNWALVAPPPQPKTNGRHAPAGWLTKLNERFPECVYAKGQVFEITTETDYEFSQLSAELKAALR